MLKFTLEHDLSDVADAFAGFASEASRAVDEVGRQAVAYAKEHGDYRDCSGRLRRSSRYEASPLGLRLVNDAADAADVEASGRDVLSGAALFAEERLKEIFE